MKNPLFYFLIICVVSCCKEIERLDNGLTKKANKVIDYSMLVKLDSLNMVMYDTVAITHRFYNDKNKIVKRNQKNLIDGELMQISYVYDEFDNIKEEIVTIPRDSTSFSITYQYRDSLIDKSYSSTENSNFKFTSIAHYKYLQNKLEKISTETVYIDVELNDTITHNLETSFYNENELLIKSVINDYVKPERNRITINEYGCNSLLELSEFYLNDSLISTTKYKHENDKHGNWTKRMSYKDDQLNFVKARKIFYK